MARRYLARWAPVAEAQSFPPFRESALRAASTAIFTSSAVPAGISPEINKYKAQSIVKVISENQ